MFFKCLPASWYSLLAASIMDSALSSKTIFFSSSRLIPSRAGRMCRNSAVCARADTPRSRKAASVFLQPSTTFSFKLSSRPHKPFVTFSSPATVFCKARFTGLSLAWARQLLQCGIELLFQPCDLLAHSQQIPPSGGIVLFHHFQELPDSGLLHQRDTTGMFPLRHCGGPGP